MKPIFILLVLTAPALFSCNPEPLHSEQKDPKALNLSDAKKRKPTKTAAKPAKTEPVPAPAPTPVLNPPKEEIPLDDVAFYLKMANTQTALTVDDVQRLRRVAKQTGKMNPLNRASLLIGVLRCNLRVNVEASVIEKAITFERTPEGGADWSKLTSLEKLTHDLNLSLKDELTTNLFVQTIVVYELVLQGIEYAGDAPSYVEAIQPALNEQSVQWLKVHDRVAALTKDKDKAQAAASGNSSPEGAQAPASVGLNTPPPSPPVAGLAPISQGPDDPIKRAQELSDKNKFEESIAILRSLEKDSTYGAAAQGKIKEVANRAVAELRTKAARAYQSSVPVSDLKARGAYLEDAKKFLSLAIQRYPESDQIDTVKQNLEMINKSLQVIKGR